MSGQAIWYCVRQRAGPLVKECRTLRPRLSANDSPYELAEKNKILRPPRDSSVCRTRVDRLELRLALFGFQGSFYTLTFDDDHLPSSFHETENVWRSLLRKLRQWLGRPFDYVYVIEGKHGDHRYHLHLVLRDSDFSPAELRYLWHRGWVDDEPLLREPGDSYRRTARYGESIETLKKANSPAAAAFRGAAYNDGTFVACGYPGDIFYSKDMWEI